MRVQELTREQLIELKQKHIIDESYHVSMNELADADELLSDEEIFEEFADVNFVPEDFLWS